MAMIGLQNVSPSRELCIPLDIYMIHTGNPPLHRFLRRRQARRRHHHRQRGGALHRRRGRTQRGAVDRRRHRERAAAGAPSRAPVLAARHGGAASRTAAAQRRGVEAAVSRTGDVCPCAKRIARKLPIHALTSPSSLSYPSRARTRTPLPPPHTRISGTAGCCASSSTTPPPTPPPPPPPPPSPAIRGPHPPLQRPRPDRPGTVPAQNRTGP